MTFYIYSGSDVRLSGEEDMVVRRELEPHVYTVKSSMNGELFLRKTAPFDLPKRLYGDIEARADRVMATFEARSMSTGVLLSGDRGLGKTLLAKLLSTMAASAGYPTILINSPWKGDAFCQLIRDVGDAVVVFDEFEKTYDRDEQQSILTLLDGVCSSRNLYVFTVNDPNRVSSHMKNRPGRVFYMFDYHGLDEPFIRDYCRDNDVSDEHTAEIVQISKCFSSFSIDSLQALVEESRRFGETPKESLKYLNIRVEFSDEAHYRVSMSRGGDPLDVDEKVWYGNPVGRDVSLSYYKNQGDDTGWVRVEFQPSDIVSILDGDGFVLEKEEHRAVLTRVAPRHFNIAAL